MLDVRCSMRRQLVERPACVDCQTSYAPMEVLRHRAFRYCRSAEFERFGAYEVHHTPAKRPDTRRIQVCWLLSLLHKHVGNYWRSVPPSHSIDQQSASAEFSQL